jgi:hypothetical protein
MAVCRNVVLRVGMVAAAFVGTACSDSAITRPNADLLPPLPLPGGLTVSTVTTGSSIPAGYTVIVDGSQSQQIAATGLVTFTGLAAGNHSVFLSGVPSNCAVSGSNPQTVDVLAGLIGTTAFTVSCTTPPTTGSLKVTNNTQGSVPTTNYTINVSGQPGTASQQMAPNGSTTFTNLPPASYTVTLSGQPANCTVTNANPQTVTVQAGQTATVSFSLSCATPPTTGNLTVANVTSGSSIPSSFTVTVDPGTAGAVSQSIAPNQSTTFTGLAAGSHSVGLTVASNCTVSGANPQTGINVPAGGTGSTSFSVSCSATTGTGTGTLTVTTSTTGSVRTGTYIVSATGPSFPNGASESIAPNGTISQQVLAGTYTVTLSGVPAGCTVTSANPQSVTVPTGGTGTAAFAVSCSATSGTGTLTVTASTTGAVPTGVYVVSATGPSAPNGASDVVAPNGTLSEQVLAGSYTVTLSGFPQNCTVTSANPVSVTVPSGGTGTAAFTVSCSATTGTLTVTASTTGAVPTGVYVVSATGPSAPNGASDVVAPNGTLSEQVLAGSYTVTLSGFPQNCTVTSANPVSVTVPVGGTATAAFTVSCSATTGTLTVTTSTTGSVPMTNYTVTVGGASLSIAPNGTISGSVAAGSYTVTLSGFPQNCTVTSTGGPSQSVTVPAGGTATVSFTLSCSAGTLTVTNTTSGPVPTTNYTVTVSGPSGTVTAPMAPNGQVGPAQVVPGAYTVSLSGLPATCTVQNGTSQNVNVPGGGSATASFAISCM